MERNGCSKKKIDYRALWIRITWFVIILIFAYVMPHLPFWINCLLKCIVADETLSINLSATITFALFFLLSSEKANIFIRNKIEKVAKKARTDFIKTPMYNLELYVRVIMKFPLRTFIYGYFVFILIAEGFFSQSINFVDIYKIDWKYQIVLWIAIDTAVDVWKREKKKFFGLFKNQSEVDL